jgi:hypothetical protein
MLHERVLLFLVGINVLHSVVPSFPIKLLTWFPAAESDVFLGSASSSDSVLRSLSHWWFDHKSLSYPTSTLLSSSKTYSSSFLVWDNSALYITATHKVQWNLGSRRIRFTNKFSEQKSLGWRTVYRITNTQAGNSGKLATASSWEYRRGSVSCWLTNLVSVYERPPGTN